MKYCLLNVSSDLHKKLREISREQRIPMRVFVDEALKRFLADGKIIIELSGRQK